MVAQSLVTRALAFYVLVNGVSCARDHAVQFHAVDAVTHEPLKEVRVSRHSYNVNMLARGATEDAILPPTDVGGRTTASDLRHWSAHIFEFEKEGYQRARAETGGSKWHRILVTSPWIPPPPAPEGTAWESPVKPVEQKLPGVVRIPMHRRVRDDG